MIYVPTLKWKRGEYTALRLLAEDVKRRIKPLLEVMPFPDDDQNLAGYMSSVADRIFDNWGRPAFVDLNLLDPDDRITGNRHPWTAFAEQAQQRNMTFTPVTGLSRDEDYQVAAAEIAQRGAGACIRLTTDEFTGDQLEQDLLGLTQQIGLVPGEVDVVLDVQALEENLVQNMRAVLRDVINDFPARDDWRSIILIGSGFPVDLTGIAPGLGAIPRAEFQLWSRLITGPRSVRRAPIFGDYVIAHPSLSDLEPGTFVASASIRYTAADEWLIFRGRAAWGPASRPYGGFNQFFDLAQNVVQNPAFSGAGFSAGDEYIAQCAARNTGPGNLETWRQVGTSHHITFAARQIANRPALAVGA